MESGGWPKPENDPTSLYKAMPDMQVVLAGLLKQLGARFDDSKEMHIFMTVPLTSYFHAKAPNILDIDSALVHVRI